LAIANEFLSLIDDLTQEDSQTDIKTDKTKHFPDLFHLLGDGQMNMIFN
jgi:hypothetical protein